MDRLVDFRQAGGTVGGEVLVINGGENGAFMDDTVCVGDCALVDTRLKSIYIPAVQEVAVESVAWEKVSKFIMAGRRSGAYR